MAVDLAQDHDGLDAEVVGLQEHLGAVVAAEGGAQGSQVGEGGTVAGGGEDDALDRGRDPVQDQLQAPGAEEADAVAVVGGVPEDQVCIGGGLAAFVDEQGQQVQSIFEVGGDRQPLTGEGVRAPLSKVSTGTPEGRLSWSSS